MTSAAAPAPAAIRHRDARLPNGMRLHVAEAGDTGQPLIVFLHGFPEAWFAWEAQLEEFGRDHHAVAPDLRGFNLSDQPLAVEAYRPKHLVEDLRLLIADCGHARCVLVAHDWGGAIAWNFAVQHPGMVERLVIINSPHPALFARELAHDPAQQAASAYMNFLRRPDAEGLLATDGYAGMWGFFEGATGTGGWLGDALRERYLACWGRGLTGGLNLYRASPLHPPTPEAPGARDVRFPPEAVTVRVSTRVLWGMSDTALLPGLLDGLETFVPGVEVQRVTEATHWIIHEQPERVNAAIRGFLP
jgi:pimeloyl-ACP methyl ester carboxylesterase